MSSLADMPSSRGKRLRLDLSLDEIEEIQGHVAAEANHIRDAKQRQRLDKLFGSALIWNPNLGYRQ